jgi:Nucleoside-diphosphate-sugar epimerases
MILPERIRNEEELDEILSTPYSDTIGAINRIKGDIMILGAGGKIGPSLVVTALKAIKKGSERKKVYAVSRFARSDEEITRKLEEQGAIIIKADLSDPDQVKTLPEVDNVIFMVGKKFGTSEDPGQTWISNSLVAGLVARKYGKSNLIIFSTGNVYPLVPITTNGSTEEDEVNPVGEYGWSALARERIFSYYIKNLQGKGAILRLNYACELRYGVLLDIALKVYKGEAIDLRTGYVNVIWQGDVNNIALRLLEYANNPPLIINVTGPIVKVRDIANEFGKLLNKEPVFKYAEEETALLSNPSKMTKMLGQPKVSISMMVKWIAEWLINNGKIYNLPTHYDVRDGRF